MAADVAHGVAAERPAAAATLFEGPKRLLLEPTEEAPHEALEDRCIAEQLIHLVPFGRCVMS